MILLLSLACAPSDPVDSATPEEVVDLRLTEADLPAYDPDHQEIWWGPDEVVQPGEDKMFCIFGTHKGPDAGVHALATHQNAFGHHLLLMGTSASALDYPDGTVLDCSSDGELGMAELEPLVLPTDVVIGGEERDLGIQLLDGMAVKIDEGQRWVLQAHYLNTGTAPIRVQDPALLTLLPEDEVETWAAPLVLNADGFTLPPNETTSLTFDCPVEQELNLLYVTGHMHEWGTAFRTEHVEGGTLYEEAAWDPAWRDAPPVVAFEAGSYSLAAGDTLRTTCEWFNDTDEPLGFPEEMCATVTVVYPQLTAIICDGA